MNENLINSISLRSWHNDDFEQSVVLNREAEEHIGMASETGDWANDMRDIEKTFIRSGGEFLIGLLAEKFVVMGGFKPLSATTAEIKRMRVTPELQGKGIGRWFLGILEDRIRSSGVPIIEVSTTSEQEGALRLYSGSGYIETGRRVEDREHDFGLTIVSFVKEL